MKVIYVAGPYKGDGSEWAIHQNIEQAKNKARELWKHGWAVICPHANTSFFGGLGEHDRELWLKGDLELLRRCDAIYMLRDWIHSEGAKAEHKLAKELGLEIYYE